MQRMWCKMEIRRILNRVKNKLKMVMDDNDGKKVIIFCIFIFFIYFVFLLVNIIPPKYWGKYRYYFYFDGTISKTTYRITPFHIKIFYEADKNGTKESMNENVPYNKRGKDLIISSGNTKYYLILNDDRLFVETNKNISTSEKYKSYYWKMKTNKSDIYEMTNNAEITVDMLEFIANQWARNTIFEMTGTTSNNTEIYISPSDETNDETDLNVYEVSYNVANGTLYLQYNKDNKNLKHISFLGSIFVTSYDGRDDDSMNSDDIYNCNALMLSSMYLLGIKDESELNKNISNINTEEDHAYRNSLLWDYASLLKNMTVDNEFDDKYNYSFKSEKYDISFDKWISSNDNLTLGTISWNIYINE